MGTEQETESPRRLVTLTVDQERMAFLHRLDIHFEIEPELTATLPFQTMTHILMALGFWAEDINKQMAVVTSEDKRS